MRAGRAQVRKSIFSRQCTNGLPYSPPHRNIRCNVHQVCWYYVIPRRIRTTNNLVKDFLQQLAGAVYRRRCPTSVRPALSAHDQIARDAHRRTARAAPVDEAQALQGLNYALRGAVSPIEVLQQTVDAASAVHPESRLMIIVYQRDGSPTIRVADRLQTVLFMNLLLEKAAYRALESRARETMQPILATPGAPTRKIDNIHLTDSQPLHVRSAIVAPFIHGDQVLGLLMTIRLGDAQAYQPADVQFFGRLLSTAGDALLKIEPNLGSSQDARQSLPPQSPGPASPPSPDSSEHPPGP